MGMFVISTWGIVAVIFVCIAGTIKLDESLVPQAEIELRSRYIVCGIVWPLCISMVVLIYALGSVSLLFQYLAKRLHKHAQSTERLN